MPSRWEPTKMGDSPANLKLWHSHKRHLKLDLWMGFSEMILLQIGNKKDIEFWSPIFHNRPFSYYQADIDLNRALQIGLLEFTTDDGKVIPLDTDELDLCELDKRSRSSTADGGRTYPLARASPGLLSCLRRSLTVGKSYRLQFCERRFKIWCETVTVPLGYVPGYQVQMSPAEWAEKEQVDVACDPEPIDFIVVPGIPIPRFTISFSISSSIWDITRSRQFFVTLKVTSLEDQPVIVHPWRDQLMGLWPDQQNSRGNETNCLDVFDLQDESSLEIVALFSDTARLELNHYNSDRLEDIRLRKEDTHTRDIHFDPPELMNLSPGHTYSLQMRPQGFAAWTYEHEGIQYNLQDPEPEEPRDRGPIIFEPISAVARTITMAFERELPRPFSLLPFELRCQIYEYIKYSERADTVRFTVR